MNLLIKITTAFLMVGVFTTALAEKTQEEYPLENIHKILAGGIWEEKSTLYDRHGSVAGIIHDKLAFHRKNHVLESGPMTKKGIFEAWPKSYWAIKKRNGVYYFFIYKDAKRTDGDIVACIEKITDAKTVHLFLYDIRAAKCKPNIKSIMYKVGSITNGRDIFEY